MLSIASDLRYHLWPMIATAMGVVVLVDGTPVPRRMAVIGAVVLAVVVATAIGARVLLPAGPNDL